MFIGSDKSVEDLRWRSDITLDAFVIGFVRLRSMLATHVHRRISSGDIYQGPEKPDKFVCFNFNMKKKESMLTQHVLLVWNQFSFGYFTRFH